MELKPRAGAEGRAGRTEGLGEAGLGRGEGGSERIREDPRGSERLGEREGGVRVELKPRAGAEGRAGRTEGLGGIRGFLAFPGRIRTRGGPFRVLSGT